MENSIGFWKTRSAVAAADEKNIDVGYSIDGVLFPQHWIRDKHDTPFEEYSALNIEHIFTVDRIVDEKHDRDGNELYRIKFVGLELDENDWYYAKDVRGRVLQKWQHRDKDILRRIRWRHQNGHVFQNGNHIKPILAAPPRVNNYCRKQKRRPQHFKLDELAYACFLVKQIEDKHKAELPEEFDFRNLHMTQAINGNYYPKLWLSQPGDKEDVEANARLPFQRIIDEFVDQSCGIPVYWVKFEGYQIQKKSIFKRHQIIDKDNNMGKWTLFQKQILHMARNQLINPCRKQQK